MTDNHDHDNYRQMEQPLPSSELPADAFTALLELADDEFVIGHRHSEWLGLSPFLEEDLTLSSIAQDEFGHARALYKLIWPTWDAREQQLVRRPSSEWRSCALTERQSPTWEWSLIRHALYDTIEPHRWQYLLRTFGTQVDLDALVANVGEEETFHRRHAFDLVGRIGNANDEARQRLQIAVDDLWVDVEALVASTVGAESWALACLSDLDTMLATGRLVRPDTRRDRSSAGAVAQVTTADRQMRHPDFASVSESLFAVLRFDPTATW